MANVSQASVFFNNIIKLDDKEWNRIMDSPAVMNMTSEEIIAIADLKNEDEIYNMLRVYASLKFNTTDDSKKLTNEVKKRALDILFDAKGSAQFVYACETFISLDSWVFSRRTDSALKVVSSVAQAETATQAKWGTIAAKNLFIASRTASPEIIGYITSLNCEDDMMGVYEEIASLQPTNSLYDWKTRIKVIEIMNKYSKAKESREYNDLENRNAKVKVKTLTHASGIRPKDES